MLEHSLEDLSRAALQTVAYSDIFDYPLTAREIHRYLTGMKASLEDIVRVLGKDGIVTRTGNYFTLPGREEIVGIRKQREARSRELMPHAIRYGRILGALPYIRMVALTGSLAVMNISGNYDFDYMLVTKPGKLWTARAFAVAFGRMVRPFGHMICVNLLLSENALTWHQHDIYSAREICQMIPITGMDVYNNLRAANTWIEAILPNSSLSAPHFVQIPFPEITRQSHRLLESPLGIAWFEKWVMKFQMQRIVNKWGTSDESNFSADMCQSNFHNHRKSTYVAFEEKLNMLAAVHNGCVAAPSAEDDNWSL